MQAKSLVPSRYLEPVRRRHRSLGEGDEPRRLHTQPTRWPIPGNSSPRMNDSGDRGRDSATDAEKAYALLRMDECLNWLLARGFPQPVVCDSCKGGHLMFDNDLPNDNYTKALIKALLAALARRFSDDRVDLDKVV